MNKKLRKAISALLGTVALAGHTHLASATGAYDMTSKVGDPAGLPLKGANESLAPYTWDGGNINTFGNSSSKGPMGPAPYDTDPNKSANLGWNHSTRWRMFEITAGGGYTIRLERTGGGANFQPAFSLFSTGHGPWDYGKTSSHSFNQVVGPDPDSLVRYLAKPNTEKWGAPAGVGVSYAADGGNSNDYMNNFVPDEGKGVVEEIVGYANTGTWFINGDGNFVRGAQDPEPRGSSGAYNPHVPGNKPEKDGAGNPVADWDAAHAGAIAERYAGVGSVVNTGQGVAELKVWLTPGWYVMGPGGSCADMSCSPECVEPTYYDGLGSCTVTPQTASKKGLGEAVITVLPNAEVTAPLPRADAGADQTATELTKVTLSGDGYDPKGSQIAAYRWRQVSGPSVTLAGDTSQKPSFMAPEVGANDGKVVLGFELVVTDSSTACDGKGCASQPATTSVTIDNDPAVLDCSAATANPPILAKANKKLVPVAIGGITGSNPYSLAITGVTSDEPVKNKAAKDTTGPDAKIKKGKVTKKKPRAMDTLKLRAEAQKSGNGRVYAVSFQATDGIQTCTGTAKVEVPTSAGMNAVDDGQMYNATKAK